MRNNAYFKKDVKSVFGTMSYINEQNHALKDIYILSSNKVGQLYYISREDLIGSDNEATKDGTHFNGVGHFRAYQQFTSKTERIFNP